MAVPEWGKVLAGTLALLIGASAPSLIIFALDPSAFIPAPLSRSAPPVGEAPRYVTKPETSQERQKGYNYETFWNDPVAAATLFLAIATAVLAYASWRAARDTRRALFLAQRPRIRIRNVVIHPARRRHGANPFDPGEFVSGQLYCVNVGGTEAHLFEAHCEVYWTNPGVATLPMERPYEGKNPNIPILNIDLPPGISTPLNFASDRLLGGNESDQINSGSLFIYVLGFVAYTDELGIMRRTAFCRKYNYGRGRFFATKDPDYEHEE